jgi:hypothetical protein
MAKLTNKHNRRDRQTGLWIQARKRVYLYWFRFLQEAEASDNHQVDWTIYEPWGGRDAVYPVRSGDFAAWWGEHWCELFGMRNENDLPRFPLSTRKVRADKYRVALLVHQLTRKHPTESRIEIADRLRDRLGGKEVIFLRGLKLLHEVDGENFDYICRSVSRYRNYAQEHLRNVCNGKFP